MLWQLQYHQYGDRVALRSNLVIYTLHPPLFYSAHKLSQLFDIRHPHHFVLNWTLVCLYSIIFRHVLTSEPPLSASACLDAPSLVSPRPREGSDTVLENVRRSVRKVTHTHRSLKVNILLVWQGNLNFPFPVATPGSCHTNNSVVCRSFLVFVVLWWIVCVTRNNAACVYFENYFWKQS